MRIAVNIKRFRGIFPFHRENCSAKVIFLGLSYEKIFSGKPGLRIIPLCFWHQKKDVPKTRHFPAHMENNSSARRDPCRAQARSRLAGEMFSHENACDILCGKAI